MACSRHLGYRMMDLDLWPGSVRLKGFQKMHSPLQRAWTNVSRDSGINYTSREKHRRHRNNQDTILQWFYVRYYYFLGFMPLETQPIGLEIKTFILLWSPINLALARSWLVYPWKKRKSKTTQCYMIKKTRRRRRRKRSVGELQGGQNSTVEIAMALDTARFLYPGAVNNELCNFGQLAWLLGISVTLEINPS